MGINMQSLLLAIPTYRAHSATYKSYVAQDFLADMVMVMVRGSTIANQSQVSDVVILSCQCDLNCSPWSKD